MLTVNKSQSLLSHKQKTIVLICGYELLLSWSMFLAAYMFQNPNGLKNPSL